VGSVASPGRRSDGSAPDPELTSALVHARESGHRVRVEYRTASGRQMPMEVDPWAVVVRHGRWYLLCHSHRADAIRTYRVDRVCAVQQTPHSFEPPDGLDAVAATEANLGSGWEFSTRVVFDQPPAEVAPWIRPPMGQLSPLPGGCVLVGSTSNPTMYAQEWLANVPLAFRVEGGRELRAAVAKLASRLNAALADKP
jgi:hypothetical protein